MTPNLYGRIQTRIVLLATIGAIWTALVVPILPGDPSLSDGYRATFTVLALVAAVGIGWEFVYHGLQQIRWEKDWPAFFGLLTGINEGLAVWLLIPVVAPDLGITQAQFAVHFGTTWVIVWFWANGPMRVVAIRWRFRGGRLV